MKKILRPAVVCLLTLVALTGCSGYANVATMMASREWIRACNIYVENILYEESIFGRPQEAGYSLGSGVVFEANDNFCYALTNWHVVEAEGYVSQAITVTDIEGNVAPASVELMDKARDIAILRYERKSPDTVCIDYHARERRDLKDGELVFAVGNPGEIRNNVTFGLYQGMAYIKNVDYAVIHHSALIYEGNSGGALCDIDGNLVGLNTWGSEYSEEDSYAIPLSVILDFIAEWRAP